ncbi:hypothetical protein [Ktedonospora formicarum]|uniref:Uncharacterized protein n=1 Tax=Ktedonospora formicarum TaxID=2778364 RepID=A0A8J3I7Z8_9CHLR|nr:hypothetical protein [Ktedonospora formicarum]GHO46374.1 hypothetical protein KSX_45370 [Ktedonospora formicarum]
MNLEQIKYRTCPNDDEDGILLVDLDEDMPATDEDGDLQYYCPGCHSTFSSDEDDD